MLRSLRLHTATRLLAQNSARFGFVRFNSTAAQKYQEKLQKKAQELGLGSVEELKKQLKDEIKAKKLEFSKIDPLKELEEYEKRQEKELEKDRSKTIKIRAPIDKNLEKKPYKTLDSYLASDKLKDLGQKEIELIWRARFENKERTLNAILTDIQFATMYANAFKNPSFILPLPRNEDGYEMHFVQWSFAGPQTTHCMLTTLAEYKLHKEYAKPHTTLMFHQELVNSKNLVLMNGQVEEEAALSMDDAQLLVLNVQRFYGAVGDEASIKRKHELLRAFTTSENFDVDTLIEEATSV
ncbi:hypothetical protein PGUG_04192 [Meyerozyma guilliermondii ATCC 6260]|uniref:Uncharacterized protein n=1 Tax=Meyerozyma guilliermondii (strain ATCC 6260 / CBS 566 / DSM 6381 / JCM 1539 / NBRC 10279 / NRRL Y-324) TaxID=294746 RepID=A5DLP1_PICGU|nr:uncharacterized protein PGUG_04192 [Meyerozyma guilliermondii ATCC 6260]EDK40094.2 hypothetical protein PGUG_04192 [Meyerozyma guilliermondii ATCC 6260]